MQKARHREAAGQPCKFAAFQFIGECDLPNSRSAASRAPVDCAIATIVSAVTMNLATQTRSLATIKAALVGIVGHAEQAGRDFLDASNALHERVEDDDGLDQVRHCDRPRTLR